MGDDFFKNRDDSTAAADKREGFDVAPEKRPLHKIVMLVVLLVVLGAAWHFTGGDLQTTALLVGAVVVSVLSLSMRLRGMKDRAKSKGMSPGRIVLNIVVAALILAAVWYFYARGLDSLLEP